MGVLAAAWRPTGLSTPSVRPLAGGGLLMVHPAALLDLHTALWLT